MVKRRHERNQVSLKTWIFRLFAVEVIILENTADAQEVQLIIWSFANFPIHLGVGSQTCLHSWKIQTSQLLLLPLRLCHSQRLLALSGAQAVARRPEGLQTGATKPLRKLEELEGT